MEFKEPFLVFIVIKTKEIGGWVFSRYIGSVFFLFQYFINYNLDGGGYLVSAPIVTNNWKVEDSFIMPFGGGVGKIFRLGKLPINGNVQAYYNAVAPEIGPKWSARLQIQLIFPK